MHDATHDGNNLASVSALTMPPINYGAMAPSLEPKCIVSSIVDSVSPPLLDSMTNIKDTCYALSKNSTNQQLLDIQAYTFGA